MSKTKSQVWWEINSLGFNEQNDVDNQGKTPKLQGSGYFIR